MRIIQIVPMGLKHPWILVPMGVLKPIPHRFQTVYDFFPFFHITVYLG